MLVVETIAKIRRAFFVHNKPIKAICRELRVSRKVVRKVLRSDATEFRYPRETQPRPRLGLWRDQLEALLLANEGRTPRERLTLIRTFEALRGLGYEGGYDAVRRYAKAWRRAQGAAMAEAYIPLSFAPGSRRRARPLVRARRDGLRSLALRAGAGEEARGAQERSAVQGLGAARRARAGPSQARRRRRW